MSYADLVSVFTRLQKGDTRLDAAHELAVLAGAKMVLIFGRDPEIGVHLPAPGLAQTLPEGAKWQAFLEACARAGHASACLPAPGGEAMDAHGYRDAVATSILVFLGGAPRPSLLRAIALLQPLLGQSLAAERIALAARSMATVARDNHQRAKTLNDALDLSRTELRTAYLRAEQELVSRREAERKLREADRRKDEFLAMLSHELRNPLAPIRMAAHVIKLSAGENSGLRNSSAVIERQVAHMTRLLDDLLDVSRVTTGSVALNRDLLDMRRVSMTAIEQVRPQLASRHHDFSVELPDYPVTVEGDETRLIQVMANLLNNAARYTPEHGAIGFSLTGTPEYVTLSVRDNGIGMSADLLPHVFDLFVQGERSFDRAQGGLGVGLALVRSLVERHGGAVSAHSDGPGKGSEFIVRLPVTPNH